MRSENLAAIQELVSRTRSDFERIQMSHSEQLAETDARLRQQSEQQLRTWLDATSEAHRSQREAFFSQLEQSSLATQQRAETQTELIGQLRAGFDASLQAISQTVMAIQEHAAAQASLWEANLVDLRTQNEDSLKSLADRLEGHFARLFNSMEQQFPPILNSLADATRVREQELRELQRIHQQEIHLLTASIKQEAENALKVIQEPLGLTSARVQEHLDEVRRVSATCELIAVALKEALIRQEKSQADLQQRLIGERQQSENALRSLLADWRESLDYLGQQLKNPSQGSSPG